MSENTGLLRCFIGVNDTNQTALPVKEIETFRVQQKARLAVKESSSGV